MARSEFMYIAIVAIIVAISTQQAMALKCWACNSVALPFCKDPFDPKNVTDEQKYFSYIDCPARKCLKTIANITITNNQFTTAVVSITRSCANSPESADAYCKDSGFNFCEICSSEGCNGATTQYGPAALMAAIPMAIAKLLVHYNP